MRASVLMRLPVASHLLLDKYACLASSLCFCMDLYEQCLVIHLTHLDLKTPINSHIAAYDQAHDTPDSACKVSH